jgi:ribosomal protein S27AE
MNAPDERLIIGCWLAIVALILGAAGYFYLGPGDAQTKRRVFRWYIIAGGVLLNIWFVLLGGPKMLAVGIPLFLVSGFVSAKTTRFCEACGAVFINQFIRRRYCSRCGADMDAQYEQRRSEER